MLRNTSLRCMNDLDKPITINPQAIILARDKAGDLTLTQEAEVELRKVLEFKKLAEDVYDFVQAKLGQAMDEQKLKKIVSGNIVVRYSTFGERYQVDESTNEKYTKEVVYRKANSAEIDKVIEETGELPEGVKLKERSSKATISYRQEE